MKKMFSMLLAGATLFAAQSTDARMMESSGMDMKGHIGVMAGYRQENIKTNYIVDRYNAGVYDGLSDTGTDNPLENGFTITQPGGDGNPYILDVRGQFAALDDTNSKTKRDVFKATSSTIRISFTKVGDVYTISAGDSANLNLIDIIDDGSDDVYHFDVADDLANLQKALNDGQTLDTIVKDFIEKRDKTGVAEIPYKFSTQSGTNYKQARSSDESRNSKHTLFLLNLQGKIEMTEGSILPGLGAKLSYTHGFGTSTKSSGLSDLKKATSNDFEASISYNAGPLFMPYMNAKLLAGVTHSSLTHGINADGGKAEHSFTAPFVGAEFGYNDMEHEFAATFKFAFFGASKYKNDLYKTNDYTGHNYYELSKDGGTSFDIKARYAWHFYDNAKIFVDGGYRKFGTVKHKDNSSQTMKRDNWQIMAGIAYTL
jgi:hypothetical protein